MDSLRTSAKVGLCVSQLYDITGSLFKLCCLNRRSVHRHMKTCRNTHYSCADIYIFAEKRCSCQDPNDNLYDITGYNLFRNDNHNSINESRPYGDTAVYSKIP